MEGKKIVDYIIIVDNQLEILEKNVLEKLNDGYVLLGGCSIGGGDYRTKYAQTLIKYED